jgi:hypothetical protein
MNKMAAVPMEFVKRAYTFVNRQKTSNTVCDFSIVYVSFNLLFIVCKFVTLR